MIRCACGQLDCKIAIYIEKGQLWFTDKDGEQTLMHLDANTIVKLIKGLKVALLECADDNVLS